jgi:DNA-binding NarL/FixJ family response regulator
MAERALRVAVVEDHPTFRRGLRAVLTAAGLELVAEAADGEEALELIPRAGADVVLVDMHLPDLNGAEVTRRLVSKDPKLRICVLSMLDDDDSMHAALRAGALGYVLKGEDPETIVRAVHSVARGEGVFSPAMAQRMQSFFNAGTQRRAEPFPTLTPRERAVLELVARGRGNAAVAGALGVSEKTVRNAVSSIFAKLHVAGRAEAIVRAREAGLGRAPE